LEQESGGLLDELLAGMPGLGGDDGIDDNDIIDDSEAGSQQLSHIQSLLREKNVNAADLKQKAAQSLANAGFGTEDAAIAENVAKSVGISSRLQLRKYILRFLLQKSGATVLWLGGANGWEFTGWW